MNTQSAKTSKRILKMSSSLILWLKLKI